MVLSTTTTTLTKRNRLPKIANTTLSACLTTFSTTKTTTALTFALPLLSQPANREVNLLIQSHVPIYTLSIYFLSTIIEIIPLRKVHFNF